MKDGSEMNRKEQNKLDKKNSIMWIRRSKEEERTEHMTKKSPITC